MKEEGIIIGEKYRLFSIKTLLKRELIRKCKTSDYYKSTIGIQTGIVTSMLKNWRAPITIKRHSPIGGKDENLLVVNFDGDDTNWNILSNWIKCKHKETTRNHN